MNNSISHKPTPGRTGTLDGTGAGDHDEPYVFGRRPRANAPFPFTMSQYGRMLVLRGRVDDRLIAGDDTDSKAAA